MDDAISLSTLLEQVFVFERYGEVLVLLQNPCTPEPSWAWSAASSARS